MPKTIKLRVTAMNMSKVRAMLDDTGRKQIPFATSRALNDTALQAQAANRGALGLRFTLRSRRWEELGIRVKFSTKNNLQANVEDWHDYMIRQEEGGIKAPRSGSFIAIPLDGARRNKNDIVRRADRPKALMASGKGFIIVDRAGQTLIMRRIGRGKNKDAVPAFLLKPKVRVEPRFRFEETVEIIVKENFRANFDKRFAEAMATANVKVVKV